MAKQNEPQIDRFRAMNGKPEQLEAVDFKERDGGGVEITVEVPRTGILKLLRGEGSVERTFGLDVMGLELYNLCDGKRTVKQLCQHFAKKYGWTQGEAEQAVTTHLKTMTMRGLIGIAVERKKK